MPRFPLFPLAALGCLGLLLSSPAARAQRDVTSEVKTLHEWAPLDAPYLAGPVVDTDVVPIFSIGFGTVNLEAALRSGTTHGSIAVSVYNYNPGVYTVSAITESSSATVVLGTLAVTGSPTVTGTLYVPDPQPPMIAPDTIVSLPIIIVSGGPSGHAKFGGKKAPFPDGFNPFDVAMLIVTNSNGGTASETTLTPVQDGYYTALSPLVAGASAPGAGGFALVHANTLPQFLPLALKASVITPGGPIIDPLPPIIFNPSTGRIVIHAHGLPASATVTYAADGTDLGTAVTDSKGNLSVFAAQGGHRKLPSTLDLFSVESITVLDGSGNLLVSGSF